MLSFFEAFHKLTTKLERDNATREDQINDFLESCLRDIALEQWCLMEEENIIYVNDDLNKKQYQENEKVTKQNQAIQ